jgi:hypothetical protein
VNSGKIKPGAVDSGKLAPESVTTTALAPNAVTAPKVGPQAILSGALAPNSVTSSTIAPEAVTPPAIAPAAVTTTAIAPEAVSNGKLKPGAVDSGKLAPGAVDSPAIAPNAITSPKIGPQAVLQSNIQNSSVGTQQISSAIPSASIFKSTSTSWTNNAYTAFSYPSTTFDSASLSGPARYQLKAPVAGIYQVTAVATWANDGCGGTRSLEFNGRRADGVTPFLPSPYIANTVPANASSTTTQSLTGMVQLGTGEAIEIWGGPGGMSCGSTTTLGSPAASLTMTWIAPGS